MKPNNFDILKTMSERNLDIRLAPLGNILRAQLTKKGTQITIGFPGDVVAAVMDGKFVGGLLLADRKQYNAVAKELEKSSGKA